MSLLKLKNNDFFPSISEWMDDFFDKDFLPFNSKLAKMGTVVPAVNIKDDKENYSLELAVPGMKKEDLKINLDKGMLTISSENKEEKEEKKGDYTRREFCFNSFSRSFSLPENIDEENIKANYNDGVLSLVIPKKNLIGEEKTKEIKIT